MGIVVTVFMLLGLLLLSPVPYCRMDTQKCPSLLVNSLVAGLLITGWWNVLGYGLSHWESFWGVAAIISGLMMVLVGVILLKRVSSFQCARQRWVASIYQRINPLSSVWIAGLLLSFLLYSITLIRLNMGLAILE